MVEREVLDLSGGPDMDTGTLTGEYPLSDLDVVLIDIAYREVCLDEIQDPLLETA